MHGPLNLQASSGADAIRQAVAAVASGAVERADAVAAVEPRHVEDILHQQFSGSASPIAEGLGASPGAAVGQVYFTADDAADAYDRGEDVILVKDETSPADVHGMELAEGILTSRGGLASHAAVVARGWGKPAVCGASAITILADRFTVGDLVVAEGDVVSIDGATGSVYLGAVETHEDDTPPELETLLGWADDIRRGHLGVRANADTAADAKVARDFGAEGIGLCRTEHQFLGDQLPLVRRMILADSVEEERSALDELATAQRADFGSLLEAMDGLPVTVRLLDPPLHEFLPDIEELVVEEAKGTLTDERARMLERAREWAELNPMIGTRGVRLGILKPDLYRTQVRALMQAAADRRSAGGSPQVEIMVPLIVSASELACVRGWIEDEIALVAGDGSAIDVVVGTMIETPRAALCAGSIAASADFFSFGTNDLTQMAFGFSRDDIEARIMGSYLEHGFLAANPFETIDVDGVGSLVRSAAAAGRQASPGIKMGVCGEHGGDPASIRLFFEAGLDYVSCSPFRVPVARLAAAQAVLGTSPH